MGRCLRNTSKERETVSGPCRLIKASMLLTDPGAGMTKRRAHSRSRFAMPTLPFRPPSILIQKIMVNGRKVGLRKAAGFQKFLADTQIEIRYEETTSPPSKFF